MAQQGDPEKSLSTAVSAILLVGAVSLSAGLIAELFEVRFLQNLGLGWTSIVFGILFLVLAHYTRQRSMIALSFAIGLYVLDALLFLVQMMRMNAATGSGGMIFRIVMIWLMVRGIGAIRKLQKPAMKNPASAGTGNLAPTAPEPGSLIGAQTLAMPASVSGPKPVSFVAKPAAAIPQKNVKRELLSKSLTPEILNLRFVAYRCEIAADHFKAIYQNATLKELKWFEVSALVLRQLPIQPPWEGKLLLDVVPVAIAEEKIQPVRILSSTYVNYGFLPQGQSASTKENIRRLSSFILSQNRSIFIDPGTDYFIHAGQPPVRFLSMSQFTEYDSQYG
jgi:hypothetical protein